MKYIFAILLCTNLVIADDIDVGSTSSLIQSKIEGGKNVTNEKISFLAFIEIKHEQQSVINGTCTGVIATILHIISVGRCLYHARTLSASGFIVRVWVGVDMEHGKPGNSYNAETIYIPKDFKKSSESIDPYDIAVITLDQQIEFSTEVTKALLRTSKPELNEKIKSIGWSIGIPREAQQCVHMAPLLHEIKVVDLEPVSDTDCGNYYEAKSESSIVCAKAKNTYRGTMGEPLTYNNQVYGLSLGIPPRQYGSKESVIAVFANLNKNFEYLMDRMQIWRAMNFLHQMQVINGPKQ